MPQEYRPAVPARLGYADAAPDLPLHLAVIPQEHIVYQAGPGIQALPLPPTFGSAHDPRWPMLCRSVLAKHDPSLHSRRASDNSMPHRSTGIYESASPMAGTPGLRIGMSRSVTSTRIRSATGNRRTRWRHRLCCPLKTTGSVYWLLPRPSMLHTTSKRPLRSAK
jgi:hypothetical protein